jgi:hypothetical protein
MAGAASGPHGPGEHGRQGDSGKSSVDGGQPGDRPAASNRGREGGEKAIFPQEEKAHPPPHSSVANDAAPAKPDIVASQEAGRPAHGIAGQAALREARQAPAAGYGERARQASSTEHTVDSAPKMPDGRSLLASRLYFLMSLEELHDQDSSWHPVGPHRIYLSAKQRYFGFEKPEAVLPLWVYHGELAPEFLDETKSWKFYDRKPEPAETLEALPKEVVEHLYQLCGLPVPGEEEKNGPRQASRAHPAPPERGALQDYYLGEAERETGLWRKFKAFLRKLFGG